MLQFLFENFLGKKSLGVPILEDLEYDHIWTKYRQKYLHAKLRNEQAGIRTDSSCTDHVSSKIIIIEQSIKFQWHMDFLVEEKWPLI